MLAAQTRSTARFMDFALIILALGAVWGFSEVVLGNFLNSTGFQYRSALLTGIGMAAMAVALVSRKPVYSLLGIALIAVVIKQLGVPLLGVSVMCKANSCLAVGLEAGGLVGVAAVLGSKMERSSLVRVAAPAVGAILAALAFWTLGRHVAPCNYLLSFSSPGSFLLKEGLAWAMFSAVLFPLGWQFGKWLAAASSEPLRPAYSLSLLGVAIIGFGASGASILSGG